MATSIVKQTKEELEGIHSKNYKSIEETVMSFAEAKMDEYKETVEQKAKDQISKVVTEEFKKVLMSTVIPHCERLVEDTMSELMSNVKQCLDENETKVKDLEEKVDKFITENQRALSEPSSAPNFRTYPLKEEESFSNIFNSNFEDSKPEIQRDTEMKGFFHQNIGGTGMIQNMRPEYPNFGNSGYAESGRVR